MGEWRGRRRFNSKREWKEGGGERKEGGRGRVREREEGILRSYDNKQRFHFIAYT